MVKKEDQDLPFLLIKEKLKESLPEQQQLFMVQRKRDNKEELLAAAEAYEEMRHEQQANKKASTPQVKRNVKPSSSPKKKIENKTPSLPSMTRKGSNSSHRARDSSQVASSAERKATE